MTSRARLRARLREAGTRPTVAASDTFVAELGHRLEHTIVAPVAALTVTRAEARDALTRLGRVTARPAPDFVAALEQRLADPDRRRGAPLVALRRRRGVLQASSAAAACVALLLLATALLGGFGSGSTGLRLGDAVNTTVVLPNGQAITGRAGLTLPNGTIVRTGPHGLAHAGSVQLGPGSQGVVHAGRLDVTPPPVPPITPTVPTPPVTAPTQPTTPGLPGVTVPTQPALPPGLLP
jgi:hypothetical protein